MSNNRIFNFNVLDEEITPDNIIAISEIIAYANITENIYTTL